MRHAPLAIGSILALAAWAGSASAHHSFSMFDRSKEVILVGTATELQWTNPHVWLEMDGAPAGAAAKHWSLEAGAVVALKRQGWQRDTIKPGDKISVVIHPLRNGDPGGSLIGVVTASGKLFGVPLTAPDKP